jgi:hypothetical protein
MIDLNFKLIASHRDIYLAAIRVFSKKVSSSCFLPRISRFINKYFYSLGIASSLNRYDNSFTIYSSYSDKKLYSGFDKNEVFINFGSGAFFHNKWKNYDYPGQSLYYKCLQGTEGQDFIAIDLCADSLVIPEKNSSVSLIYCSHTLEHLEETSAKYFLKECYRILRPDGVMRIALPNTKNDTYIYNCLAMQSECSEELKDNYLISAACHILSDAKKLPIYEIKELFTIANNDSSKFFEAMKEKYIKASVFDGSNPDRHITYWDFNKLISVSDEIGFKFLAPVYPGVSMASPFTNINVFDNTEPQHSFYAELVK